MTTPLHLSRCENIWMYATLAAHVGECSMMAGMITALVSCALGRDWKYPLLIGIIGFAGKIYFGGRAKTAEDILRTALMNRMTESAEAPNRIHAVVVHYRAT